MKPRAAGLGVGGEHGSPGRPGSLAAARTPVSADTALFVLAVGGWLRVCFLKTGHYGRLKSLFHFTAKENQALRGVFCGGLLLQKRTAWDTPASHLFRNSIPKQQTPPAMGWGWGVIGAQTHQPQSPKESIQVMLATFLTAETKHPKKIKLEEGRFTYSGLQFERMWPVMINAG